MATTTIVNQAVNNFIDGYGITEIARTNLLLNSTIVTLLDHPEINCDGDIRAVVAAQQLFAEILLEYVKEHEKK